jgi:hypothetical protein
VGPDLLDDLPTDAVHRIQRAHRVLEDHRDARPADPLQLLGRGLDQLGAVEGGLPLELGVGPSGQAHQGHRGDRLTRTRLADDGDDLAGLDRERDPVDGLDDPILGGEGNPQAVDRKQRRGAVGIAHMARRIRGSRNA